MTKEDTYKQKITSEIRNLLAEYECQPILFIGSGLPRRYFGAPNWLELLEKMFEKIPDYKGKFKYYQQKLSNDPVKIGTKLADLMFEWAWNNGKTEFPKYLFEENVKKDFFLKYATCEYLEKITPQKEEINKNFDREIRILSEISPHAIITTNYDLLLEEIFAGYEPITGQTILKYNTNSFGEIFHIHGDVNSPETIVLTKEDYEEWGSKKKYISAKLLTYFAEHPVFIFGYNVGDQNVKEILRDIGEIVADENGLIPNVYQVIWKSYNHESPPSDYASFTLEGKEFRTKSIQTDDLEWVFKALKSKSSLKSINPKLIRALAARTMKLIRHDIPSGNLQVNYDILENVAENQDTLPTILGITATGNLNQTHPFTLTQVAKHLNLKNWQAADKIIHKIHAEKGINLKESDNNYHWKIKTGTKDSSSTRKWSREAIELLRKAGNNEEYEVKL